MRMSVCVGYSDEDTLVVQSMSLEANRSLIGGIVFEGVDAVGNMPDTITYKLRFDPNLVPSTMDSVAHVWYTWGSRTWFLYFLSGFVYLQDLVDHSIIALRSGQLYNLPTLMFEQFPSPTYIG